MSVLLRAEQIARAADLQIAHGELETGTKLGVFADRVEPAAAVLGEDFAFAVGEIGVGVFIAAPDPASNLVELGKAQPVRVLNDKRVDVYKRQPAERTGL